MTSPTAFDVLYDNSLAVLQLIEALMKIQPTVGAVLHAEVSNSATLFPISGK